MQVLVGRLPNSHSCIKLAGRHWDATLIKFKSNELAGVWRINSTLITPGLGSWESCFAVVWKEKIGRRQAADCKSLSPGISSRVLEGVIVTLKSSEWRQLQDPAGISVRAKSLSTVGSSCMARLQCLISHSYRQLTRLLINTSDTQHMHILLYSIFINMLKHS